MFWVNRISASGNLCHWSVSMIAIYTYYLRSCKWSLVGSYLKCLYWNENLLHLCMHTVTKRWAIRHFDACSGGNPAAERHLVWRPLVSTSLLPQATSGHPFSLFSSPLGQLQQVGGTCNARIASSSGALPRSLYNTPRAVAFDAFLSEFFDPFAIPRFMSCESIRVQRIVWPVKACAPDRGDVLWPVRPYVSFYFYSFINITRQLHSKASQSCSQLWVCSFYAWTRSHQTYNSSSSVEKEQERSRHRMLRKNRETNQRD